MAKPVKVSKLSNPKTKHLAIGHVKIGNAAMYLRNGACYTCGRVLNDNGTCPRCDKVK